MNAPMIKLPQQKLRGQKSPPSVIRARGGASRAGDSRYAVPPAATGEPGAGNRGRGGPPEERSGKEAFGRFLRFWRGVFGLSQEDLAELLDCSPRHVSRLENLSSHPSESLVQDLCRVLRLGRRDSNHLRIAAGFAPEEPRVDFFAPEYRWLRKAMAMNLKALDPYPTVLLDSSARVVMVNRGWVRFFQPIVPAAALQNIENYYEFLFHRDGAGSKLSNWDDTFSVVLMSIAQHALFSDRPEDREVVERLQRNPYLPEDWQRRAARMEPMTSFRLQVSLAGGLKKFFSVMSTVGAMGPAEYNSEPNLSIHTLYPEDEDFDLSMFSAEAVDHPLVAY